MRTRLAAFLAFGLLSMPAYANDSSAEMGAGGLVLTKSPDVEMRSEDLYISAALVRVNYVFFNRSQKDVTTLVAFPMPDIKGEGDVPHSIPTEDPSNLLAFSTLANGRPVAARVEQKVFGESGEYTALLQGMNVPLAPHLEATNIALDRLPPSRKAELLRLKLVEETEYDVGKGMEKHLEPRWTLKTTWYWEQTFPAGAETRIEHRYKPATGASAGTSLGKRTGDNEQDFRYYQARYCLDGDFMRSIERAAARARMDFGAPFTEERIAYILKTAANWAGPIASFRLVVDKGAPENIVSFCGSGLRKISPTQFEMRRENFVPDRDLHILIMKPLKLQ